MRSRKKVFSTALTLVKLIDEGCITGRQHYRTKQGKFLETLDQVIVAIMEDNLMPPQPDQVGILFENSQQLPLDTAIGLAVTKFLQAPHCGQSQRTPEEAHINPTELNGEAQNNPYGLTLVADKDIPAGRIRICTRETHQ